MPGSPFARRDRSHLEWPSRTYGRSALGTSLQVWLPERSSPQGLVLAAIHGNEPETTVTLSAALRAVPPSDLAVAVVLCANPDGTALGLRCNARGVDLNRNFPTGDWGPPAPGELLTGASPGSEPETSALLALIATHRPGWVLSVHADLACVDDPEQTAIGALLADRSGLPRVRDVGYPTPGSFGTWCGENALPVVTLELERQATQDLRRRWGPILVDVLRGSTSTT